MTKAIRNPIRLINAGKGGAGKTTVATSLLSRMMTNNEGLKLSGEAGLNVFVVDADPAETLAKAMGWEEYQPAVCIGELKDKLLETDIPEGMTKTRFVLQKVMADAISKIRVGENKINFSVMGHHEENSCMCAFNTAVNDVLMEIMNSKAFDVIIADKEAGIEHINRAVYSGENDIFMIATWPRPDYLRVAKEILQLADALGTTRNRFVVVNNPFGGLTYEQAGEMLKKNGIEGEKYFVYPSLGNIFEGGLPAAIEANPEAQAVLDSMIEYIVSVKNKKH